MGDVSMWITIIEVIAFMVASICLIHFIGVRYSANHSGGNPSTDDFNKIAVALGAIMTVAWGFFTYGALEQRDRAKVELLEIQNRIKDTESTFFSVTSTVVKGDDFYYLNPTVKIKNDSKRAIYIKLDVDSLVISRVVAKGDKIITIDKFNPMLFSAVNKDGNTPITQVVVPVGAERDLNYLISTNYPGMYYITFTASAMDEDGNLIAKDYDGKPVKWFSSSYVYVK